MLIKPKYEIWEVAGAEGADVRYRHVLIERTVGIHGLAIASNGVALAVVPVILAADDVPGLVWASHFRLAIEAHPDATPVMMTLGADWVDFAGGGNLGRAATDLDPYPDWRKVVPAERPGAGDRGHVLILDAEYIAQVARALGTWQVILTRGATWRDPVLIEANRDAEELQLPTFAPPYGLLMPCGFYGEAEGMETTKRRTRTSA